MAFSKGGSGSATSGALVINNDHIFNTIAERDAYFVVNNIEMIADTYCTAGAVLYKLVAGSWVDVSNIVKGVNGTSVTAQFSADDITWVANATADSNYIRYSINGGVSYTSSYKFVGLDGDNGSSISVQYTYLEYTNTWYDTMSSSHKYLRIVTTDKDGNKSYTDRQRFVATDGYDGGFYTPQYSVDDVDYHDTLQSDDLYIRWAYSQAEMGEESIGVKFVGTDSVSGGSGLTDEQLAKVDAIEGVFTVAYEDKLANLTDHFKGIFASSAERDITLPTPISGNYCKQNDTGSFWFYGEAWVDSGSSSLGDMLASMYDPQSISGDTFDRSNHTGTQATSTVTDLDTALTELYAELNAVTTKAEANEYTGTTNTEDIATNTSDITGINDFITSTSTTLSTQAESIVANTAKSESNETALNSKQDAQNSITASIVPTGTSITTEIGTVGGIMFSVTMGGVVGDPVYLSADGDMLWSGAISYYNYDTSTWVNTNLNDAINEYSGRTLAIGAIYGADDLHVTTLAHLQSVISYKGAYPSSNGKGQFSIIIGRSTSDLSMVIRVRAIADWN